MNDLGDNGSTSVGRRTAIKTAAGFGAGAIVWAEPSIKGLVRRPAYADSGSGGPVTVSGVVITGTINSADGSITNIIGGTGPIDPLNPTGPAYNFVSDPVPDPIFGVGQQPRLRLTNSNGSDSILRIAAATYDAGPGGPAGDPFISDDMALLNFVRLDELEAMAGDFAVTVDILCDSTL